LQALSSFSQKQDLHNKINIKIVIAITKAVISKSSHNFSKKKPALLIFLTSSSWRDYLSLKLTLQFLNITKWLICQVMVELITG